MLLINNSLNKAGQPSPALSAARVRDLSLVDAYDPKDALILQHFAQFVALLLEAEADAICGVPRRTQSDKRINYRAGYHIRKLRLKSGVITVRVPNLRYIHSRPGMCKRFKRLEPLVLQTLSSCLHDGVQLSRVSLLINELWTMELPVTLHAELTAKATALLEKLRREHIASGAPAPLPAYHSPQQAAPAGYSVY